MATSRFDVYVIPRSKKPGPHGTYDGIPRLRVKAPPVDGAANEEAERLLTEILGARVRLASGGRSRRKTFETELDNGKLAKRLAECFSGLH